jgi:NitT/TauT family transport system substrate-binding protein
MSRWIRFSFLPLIALVLLMGLTTCGIAAPPAALTPLAVQLRWTHQAQFAGYYAADQKGYYAVEGLTVSFLEGGPAVDSIQPVLDGKAQFGISTPDGLIAARAAGQPVRAIAAIYRRSPSVYMALTASGIRRPADFAGKTIEVGPAGRPTLNLIASTAGLRPDQFTAVDSQPDLARFYLGQVQVRAVFLTNEVLTAKAAGYQLNLIYPDDYGIHFYGDIIFTTDDLIARRPELALRFLRATLKGWTYAVENAHLVPPMVAKLAPAADVTHESAFMLASLPLINTGEDHIGWMKPEIWNGMEKTLRAQGVLTRAVTTTDVYTMQFLNEIYP